MSITDKATLKTYFDDGSKPTGSNFADLIDSYTHVNDSGISSTVAELQTAISSNSLQPGATYAVSNSQYGGTILVTAVTQNKLDSNAVWLRNTNLPGFGWIRLTGGAAGSVNTLTVNGVNLMTASVPYTTSLNNTASLVAANINANGSSAFSALTILDAVVVVQKNAGSSDNGKVISATSTTITTGSIQNIVKGQDPTLQTLLIIYDPVNDRITRCQDVERNNIIEMSEIAQDYLSLVNIFNDFRWGDNAFTDNYAHGGSFKNNFFTDDSAFSSNKIYGYGKIYNNIGSTYCLVGSNELYDDVAEISNNLILDTSYCQISGNNIHGSISFNSIVLGSGIFGNTILAAYDSEGTGTINGNKFSSIYTQITSNRILGGVASINNNILSGSLASILFNHLTSYKSSISSNTLSGANSLIQSNIITGQNSSINSNTLTTGSAAIIANKLSGQSTTINSNTITGPISNNGIISNELNGTSSGINSINFNSQNVSVNNLVLDAPNAVFSGITFDATFRTITNIHWTADNRICYNIIRTGLSNAANNGATGSDIRLALLPAAKMYPVKVLVEGNALAGSGASVNIGIETDAASALMSSTAITSLGNGTIVEPVTGGTPAMTFTKSTAANRRIIAQVTGANLTAGALQITAEFKISNF